MVLSVVIPVYNVAQYLEQCVDSVLASQETDYEILLVDDGSTDGVCPGICDRYALANPDRIRVIHQENQGLGGAWAVQETPVWRKRWGSMCFSWTATTIWHPRR